MYSHILVPTDGTDLSIQMVGDAVRFAAGIGARITFFYAAPDYLATQDGAVMRAVSPELAADKASEDVRAILSKAEAEARAVGVEYQSQCKISDRPYEAIIHAAEELECDLIFTASRGPKSIGGLMLGSETLKVLMHSTIPVLVSSIARNSPSPAMDKAISIIQREHRSIAVVLHGLKHAVKDAQSNNSPLDLELVKTMLYYMRAFPDTLHHPKENAYLFAKLRLRTQEMNDAISGLEQEHVEGPDLLAQLEGMRAQLEAGNASAFDEFAQNLERYIEAQWKHMSTEEAVVIPAAKKYLLPEDWTHIAEAFGKNGDPRFGAEKDHAFQKLFAKIARLLPA